MLTAISGSSVVAMLLPYVLPYLGQIAVAIILALMAALGRLILKMKDGKVKHVALAVADATKEGFLFAEAKVAPKLRGPDGKLSKDAGALVKAAAIEAAFEYLTQHAVDNVRADIKKSDEELKHDLGLALEAMAVSRPSNDAVGVAVSSEKLVVTLPSGRKLVTVAP